MRLELTRKSDLALRAVRHLATAGGRVKGEKLAAAVGATPAFLPQVVAPLVREGWGYRLVRAPSEISVLDLIEAIEGKTDTGRCVLRGAPCGDALCALHDAWARARTALLSELARTPAAIPEEEST